MSPFVRCHRKYAANRGSPSFHRWICFKYTLWGYMAHIKSHSAKIVARIHRIAGQIAAIERSVTNDAPCADTLNLVAAVRGAVAGLMDELVDGHIRAHVAAADLTPEERTQGADELTVVLRRYVR